jgi:hypothetical protein
MYDVGPGRRPSIWPEDTAGVIADDPNQLILPLSLYPDRIRLEADPASTRTNASGVTPTWDKPARSDFSVTDRISAPAAASARPHEIRGNRPEDALAALNGRTGWRGQMVAVVLAATFGLGWFSGSHSHRLTHFAAALNPFASRTTALPEKKIATTIESPVVSPPAKRAPDKVGLRKLFASAASTADYKPAPPRRAALAPSPVSLVNPEKMTSPGSPSAQDDEKAWPRLTPVPETKPETIEGWTVRRVDNGMAVLEGPGGVWQAKQGDNVPGVGRVDSIVLWGGRWIVATSTGLISTP